MYSKGRVGGGGGAKSTFHVQQREGGWGKVNIHGTVSRGKVVEKHFNLFCQQWYLTTILLLIFELFIPETCRPNISK